MSVHCGALVHLGRRSKLSARLKPSYIQAHVPDVVKV